MSANKAFKITLKLESQIRKSIETLGDLREILELLISQDERAPKASAVKAKKSKKK